jgi:hypothetical protein
MGIQKTGRVSVIQCCRQSVARTVHLRLLLEYAMLTDSCPEKVELAGLDQQLASAEDGEMAALTRAVATYETALATAHEAEESDRYRGISRACWTVLDPRGSDRLLSFHKTTQLCMGASAVE